MSLVSIPKKMLNVINFKKDTRKIWNENKTHLIVVLSFLSTLMQTKFNRKQFKPI